MANNETKPLILIDGSSYLYRAFHAMPSLTNSKKIPTGAIYGVINMLRKLLTDYQPEQLAVVFDAKGKTFRDDLYSSYKANRQAMPDDLSQQIAPIHAIIKALGLPILMIEGVEADDVIGTLAKQAAKEGRKTLISTGDKDLAQLVDESITLVNTMTGTVLNPQTVKEKFGIGPELFIDYLTLIGDTIDNIPGVPQVGPKTAVKWLQEYGSLDNIVANAHAIKGKVGENFRAFLPQLPLSKELVTIKKDVQLSIHSSDLKRATPDKESLIKLYKEFEFKNWLGELVEKTVIPVTTHTHYQTILTENELEMWFKEARTQELIAISLTTTSLNYMDADIVGLAFAVKPGKAAYIPIAHQYENVPTQLSKTLVLEKLKIFLENTPLQITGHNLKFLIEVLANHGIYFDNFKFDVMLKSYVLDSSSTRHEKNILALRYLEKQIPSYEDIAGKGVKQIAVQTLTLDKATGFTAQDADITLQLHQFLGTKFLKENSLRRIYEEIELPLIHVLARMERRGVLIDAELLNQQTIELENRLKVLEKEIFEIAGTTFNIGSPKQLQEILFDQLKLPVLQKTPTGQPSTADAVLQELALEYPLPKLIILHRSLSKLISTYTKKLPEQIHPKTKRIHTSYNQTGAVTGRLSSSDPNLQNIPIRTPEGQRIRKAFIAAPGYKMISADYSQIELRLMAHISNDPNLLHAFENNLDIHTATAAEILDVPLDQITSEQRRHAKAINFGLIYGMSAFGLSKQIGTDRQTAQNYIERYFARYPNVRNYMETTRQKAREQGFVETLEGRRLYLPEINSRQMMRQKAAERAAINAPLQGSAADIIKLAMISIDRWIQNHPEVDAKMIMQVHDELVFEVSQKDVPEMVEVIRKHMMNAVSLKVPLLVSIGIGNNWDEASKHL